jgi:thymidylate synthase ThyX
MQTESSEPNGISAGVIADSISPAGVRLTTIEVKYPRFIHAEMMTHRTFSRNGASSRAIPISKVIQMVEDNTMLPVWWGKNQKGMQAAEELDDESREIARQIILKHRDHAIETARALAEIGLHKQIGNRYLEPFQQFTLIVTSTEWRNFFHLRRHPDAQPEFRATADAMWKAMASSEPEQLEDQEWHLPYILDTDLDQFSDERELAKISSARCARVSYLTHDTGKIDVNADLGLYGKLSAGGHLSPTEHAAQATTDRDVFYGNLRGWMSLRYQTPYEWDILGERAE